MSPSSKASSVDTMKRPTRKYWLPYQALAARAMSPIPRKTSGRRERFLAEKKRGRATSFAGASGAMIGASSADGIRDIVFGDRRDFTKLPRIAGLGH